MDDYVRKLVAQCEIYDIRYIVLDTSGRTQEDVAKASEEIIKIFIENEAEYEGNVN